MVASIVVDTKNRIDAGKPYISPIHPKMIGDIAPGRAPIEKRRPK